MKMASSSNELHIFYYNTTSFFYLICSCICLAVSITLTNINKAVTFYYTSCHGDGTSGHGIFILLCTIQVIMTVFVWHKSPPVVIDGVVAELTEVDINGKYDAKANGLVSTSASRRSAAHANMKSKGYASGPIDDSSSMIGESYSQDLERRFSESVASDVAEELNKTFRYNETYDYIPVRLQGICWNSFWMLTIYAIFFLGLHASLMGWQYFGYVATTSETLKTCAHLAFESPEGEMTFRNSFISDFSFIEAFTAIASTTLLVRKFKNPFLIANYFYLYDERFKFAGANAFYFFQALLQITIIFCAVGKISLAWLTGFGTPFQIMSGLFLSFVSMWVITVITHVLQVDRHPKKYCPDLEYHWLWMIGSLAIIWICGILFYFSVYGLAWNPYLVPHFSTWMFLFLLTYLKFNSIFYKATKAGNRSNLALIRSEETYILSDRC